MQINTNYLLQFEIVKSVVNEVQSRILLCGAFDLLKIEQFNSSLIRRTKIVPFDRSQSSELKSGNKYGNSFRDVVANLLKAVPIEVEADVNGAYEYFFMMCIGCVGILKDWLVRALELALHDERPVLTKKIIEDTAVPKKHLLTMDREAKLGELAMDDISSEILAAEMGFEMIPSFVNNKTKSPGQTLQKKRGNSKPGTRLPSRDPVGEIINE